MDFVIRLLKSVLGFFKRASARVDHKCRAGSVGLLWPVLGSAALVIPCFWHPRIAAGDLGSHVYNAWVYNNIIAGKVEGYSLSGQINNVLFDSVLSVLGRIFGYVWAERLAVSAAVWIFFWGAWHWIRVATGRRPWSVVPILAMITYGWTFHAGFFNFYLSVGFAFLGLAVFSNGSGWRSVLCPALACLSFSAHPLGFIWLVGAISYTLCSSRCRVQGKLVLLGFVAAALVAIRLFIRHERFFALPASDSRWFLNGSDQIVLGSYYWGVLLVVAVVCIPELIRVIARWGEKGFEWPVWLLPIELYLITMMVVATQPSTLHVPWWSGTVGFILERTTLISAVLLCGCAALLPFSLLKRWVIGSAAVLFFGLVYSDTAWLNRMEKAIAATVRTVPAGSRVLGTFDSSPPNSRLMFNWHMLDRSCIGHCFSYSNYEPSTGQFRIRASESNRNVLIWGVGDAVKGNYVVRTEDLPVYQVYQDPSDRMKFGIRSLSVGEKNGSKLTERN